MNSKINQEVLAGKVGLLALLIVVMATGCHDDPDEMSLRFDAASNTIEVDFSKDDPRIAVGCTEYLKAYRIENGERGAQIGSDFDPLDFARGYILDGELKKPYPGDGCDVMWCMPLKGTNSALGLTEYHLEGTHVLTEAEKAEFEAWVPEAFGTVDEVNVYTTSNYIGVAEVELTYVTTEECHEAVEAQTEVQRISVE